MFRGPLVAPLHECTDRGWSGVKDRDAEFFDDFPKAVGLRPVRCAFVKDASGSICEWTVNEIAVTGDPPNIGGAPVNVFLAKVKNILARGSGAGEVSTSGVEDSLRFSG